MQNSVRLQAFSIFDKVALTFAPPFFMPNVGMAVRAFGDDVVRPNSQIGVHPQDYDLYHVGAFDDATGEMISLPEFERKVLARALDYKVQAEALAK